MPVEEIQQELDAAQRVELRSERVQEIIGQMPGWTIRYGITVIFGAILLVLLLAWLVRYPDAVNAPGVLTTTDPPRNVLARSEGRLVRILVNEGDTVAEGTGLAVIESAANPADVNRLAAILPELDLAFANSKAVFPQLPDLALGEGLAAWAAMRGAAAELQAWRADPYREKELAGMRDKMAMYRGLIRSTEKQLAWSRKKLANHVAEAATDSILAGKGVISTTAYREKQNSFIDQQVGLADQEHGLQQTRMALLETEQQLNGQLQANETKQRTLEDACRSGLAGMRAFLETWRLGHTLTAPVAGRVWFAGRITVNRPVESGAVLFSVAPMSSSYLFEGAVPADGSGKVHVGQSAYVQLAGFPSEEYGKLVGMVVSISPVPHEDSYRVLVDLPQGLRTSYQQKLTFGPEMKGSVEIVARERSVLGRIFDKVRGALE
jgi:multidrug efflux pump subunit AcrA (membrane-fusion protein)